MIRMSITKAKRFFASVLFSTFLLACEKNEVSDYGEKHDLSIMSFNIRFDTSEDNENQWSNRKEACVKMLDEKKPDILGIQEGLENQVTYLNLNLLGYSFIGVGRDNGLNQGEYAAIFYKSGKFKLLDKGSFWLSETPDKPSIGWDANNIRIVTWGKFENLNEGNTFYVFNTHFDHKGKIAQKESSHLLIAKVKEIVTAEKSPVFLLGDFNILFGNARLGPITSNFESARNTSLLKDNYKSYNAWGRWYLNRNIDFIFYKNASILSFKTVVDDYGVAFLSDHYPILGYFDFE